MHRHLGANPTTLNYNARCKNLQRNQ
jgi:hypothetical protein